MNDKNSLEYIAKKFFEATCFLSNYSGTRGNAIAELLKGGFSRFMQPGLEYKNVPLSIAECFKILKKEQEYLEKMAKKERQDLIKKYPEARRGINANTTVATIAARLKCGGRTERIINSICFIAFELNNLKYKNLSDITFVSCENYKTEIH